LVSEPHGTGLRKITGNTTSAMPYLDKQTKQNKKERRKETSAKEIRVNEVHICRANEKSCTSLYGQRLYVSFATRDYELENGGPH
jgi:hypothetical protein